MVCVGELVMEKETFEIEARIVFHSTFYVEAKDMEVAERKLARVLDATDLFEVVEGKNEKFLKLCNRNDVHGAPHNEYEYEL
tara:strand:- start:7046 stop:7291 length:246 start_codon:yes stop_codon:yes gene_type:complete